MATTATTAVKFSYAYEQLRSSTFATTKEQKDTSNGSKTTYANGTGAQQITHVHSSLRSLTQASGTEVIDLTLLTDPANNVIGFTNIKEIYIRNLEPDGGTDMLIGGAGSNAWTGPFNGSTSAKNHVGPGGEFFMRNKNDGWVVSATNKLLQIEHDGDSAGDLDYELYVIGTND